ncbi:MAG: hypothetical protein ABI672_16515, partial [Vicinamibacteria bacterium]
MKLDARRAVMLVLLVASVVYHGARLYVSVTTLANPSGTAYWPFSLQRYSTVVAEPRPEAAEAGLQPGDMIQRVGDRRLNGFGDVALEVGRLTGSGFLRVEIVRNGATQVLDLPLTRPPARRTPISEVAGAAMLDFLLPLFFLGLGFTV